MKLTVWRWWYALRPVSHHLKVVCYLLSVLASLAFYVVFRPISPEHFETPDFSLEMLISFTPLILVTVLAFWVPWARRDTEENSGPLKVFLTSLIFFLTLLIRLVFWGLVTLLLFCLMFFLFSPVLMVLLFDIRFWGLLLIFLVLHMRIE